MYRMRRAVLIVVLFSITVSASGAESIGHDDGTYAYIYVGGTGETIINEKFDSITVDQDISVQATFCKKDSKYYCFDSISHHFAVPKHLTKEDAKWNFNGYTYNIVSPLQEVTLFGATFNMCIISNVVSDKKHGTAIWYYYYSPKHGLLGYGLTSASKMNIDKLEQTPYPIISMLSGKIGFGAENN